MKTVLLFCCITFISGTSSAQEVKIAFFQAQPHIIYESESGKIFGTLYTFIEQYIAPQMRVNFVWDSTPTNVSRQLSLLKNGKIDASAILISTKKREKKFCFTSNPFAQAKAVLGILNDNELKAINKIEDILHLKIGYAANNYLSPFMRDDRINFEFVFTGKPNEQNLKKLKMGRIDAVYLPDKAGLLSEIKLLSMEKMINIIELPDAPANLHVVFAQQNKKLAERYDDAYQKIDGDRLYRKLLSEYLDIKP